MQVRCKNPVATSASIVLTLDIKSDGDTTSTAVATLAAPVDEDEPTLVSLPGDLATDLVAAVTGTSPTVSHTTRSILDVTSITGGQSGNVYEVVILPDYSTFYQIPGVTKADITPTTRRSLAIPSGFDAARWTKFGRGEIPKFEATAVHTGHMSSLAGLDGQIVTAMLEIWKG